MAIPLRRCHATLISLPAPKFISTNLDLHPPLIEATPSTASTTAPIFPAPAPSASSSSSSTQKEQRKQSKPAEKVAPPPNPAELPFPLLVPYACSYACGPELCERCALDRPPIGHKNPIPNFFFVSTIIRQPMPHGFKSLEEIKEREIATGVDRPKDWEPGERDGDDVEYGPSRDFKPSVRGSDKPRPKKSCFRKRESARRAPHQNPSSRIPLIRRSTEDIKAFLDEALANRIQLNYEGPMAIITRNAIHIPHDEPFKWEAQYTGPPSEASRDGHNHRSKNTAHAVPSTSDLAPSIQEDLEDETTIVVLLLQSRSKKRRYATDDDDTTIDSTIKTASGPPTKKPRTTMKLLGTTSPSFTALSSLLPSSRT